MEVGSLFLESFRIDQASPGKPAFRRSCKRAGQKQASGCNLGAKQRHGLEFGACKMKDFFPKVSQEALGVSSACSSTCRAWSRGEHKWQRFRHGSLVNQLDVLGPITTALRLAGQSVQCSKTDRDTAPKAFDAHWARYGGRLLGGAGEGESAGLYAGLPPTLIINCLIAGVTATTFGFDTGASSAALHNLVHHGGLASRELTPLLQGWVISSIWVGNFLGTISAYILPDSRTLLIGSGMLNAVGGLSTALAPNLMVLITGRLMCGIGNGFVAVALSQYLGEIAPPEGRGGTIACLETAYISGALLGALTARYYLEVNNGWRYAWGCICPLGTMATIAMLRMPRTPRVIFAKAMAAAASGDDVQREADSGGTGGADVVAGSIEERRQASLEMARREASQVMCQLRGLAAPDDALIAELDDLEDFYRSWGLPQASTGADSSDESGNVAVQIDTQDPLGANELSLTQIMGSPVHRYLLFVGGVSMISPGLTGHPAMMTYATQVFESVGYHAGTSANLTVLFQSLKLAVTIPDFLWLDVIGRRKLMFAGLIGIILSYMLAIVAIPLHSPALAALAILSSCAVYQASVGPLSWIMPPEVFSADMRSRGSAVTATMYAFFGLAVVQLHPWLARRGAQVPLAVYTVSTGLALLLNYKVLPETRGMSLEEIERQVFGRPPNGRASQAPLQVTDASDRGPDT